MPALKLDASDGKALRKALVRMCETMSNMVSHKDFARALSKESLQTAARLIEACALPPVHQRSSILWTFASAKSGKRDRRAAL